MSDAAFTTHLLNRLRMRQVALLLEISEHRTLRAAAQRLGMTQPAASKMLHELEAALGEKLFARAGRGLQLNPAGEAVVATFRNLRNSMAALGHELEELRLGSAGKLFVGSIMVAVPTFLSRALVALKARYPLLSIEVQVDSSDRLIELLRAGRLDVVIGRMPTLPADQDCVFRPIAEETIAVAVSRSHPLLKQAKKKKLPFAALLAYSWIVQPRGSPSREVIEQEFRSHHATLPLGVIETTSILIATNLIAQNNMIAAMPESIASHYAEHGMLAVVPYSFTHTLTPWGSLVHGSRSVNPITRDFLGLLHEDAS